MKILFMIFLAGSSALFAQEMAPVSEEGWLHSKQAGRYSEIEPAAATWRWIDGVKIDATLRTFWIDERSAGQKTTATALGGFLGAATPEVYGVSAYANLYVSQRLWGLNPTREETINTTAFDATEGFAYFGEAELLYRYDAFHLRAGRMRLQTPYADEDDIGMVPNTFEGAVLSYDSGANTALHLLYLTRWAGFDSTDDAGDQSGFKTFAPDSAGMLALGAVYSPSEKSEYNAWYYRADRLFDLVYLEAAGHHYFTPQWHLEWGVQAAQMSEQDFSGIEGGVTGAMALMHYGNVYAGGACNYAAVTEGHYVTDGFGGGPYYTSLDESTIAGVSELSPGHDVSVWRAGAGADIAWWRHGEDEGFHLEAVYGRFDLKSTDVYVIEKDLVLWLGIGDTLRVDAVLADFDVENSPDPDAGDFQRFRVRLGYTF
jgi:hypothetical protein